MTVISHLTVWHNVLNFKADEPLWEDRDRFILSKGHACLGYYSVLFEKGYFKREDLNSFEKNNISGQVLDPGSRPELQKSIFSIKIVLFSIKIL